MTILVILDQEGDLVWSYSNNDDEEEEELLDPEYIACIVLDKNIVRNRDIYTIRFNDEKELKCAWLDRVLVIGSQQDMNRALMNIRDVVRTTIDGLAIQRHRLLLDAIFGGGLADLPAQSLICEEVVSDCLRGVVRGGTSSKIKISHGDKYEIKVRPENKATSKDGLLTIQCSPRYYEQVTYSCAYQLPFLLSCKHMDKDCLLLRIGAIRCELVDIMIRIPAVKTILLKQLEPDNLNQRCDLDLCLTWTIACLHPGTEYSLLIQPANELRVVKGTVSFSFEYYHPDITSVDSDNNDLPINTTRYHIDTPWQCA